MAKRSPQYEALARQFSARLGFDARDLFEELIGTIEQGLVGAARGPHDSDKVSGIDAAVRKYIKTLPEILEHATQIVIGNAFWAVENYGRALNLGVTRVPWQVSFTSAPLTTWGAELEIESSDGLGDHLLDTYYGTLNKGGIRQPECRITLAHHYPVLAPHADEPEQHNKLYLEIDF